MFMAYQEDKASEQLDQQVDNNNYDPSSLITIKIPLRTLPYYNNSVQYERQYGHVEIGGITYNFVKQRIYNDSLEILCIPDVEAMKLRKEVADLFKMNSDPQHSGQGRKSSGGIVFKYYSPGNCVEKRLLQPATFYKSLSKNLSRAYIILPFYYTTVIENPPEHC